MQDTKTELLQLLRRNDVMRAALIVGKVQDVAFDPTPHVDTILELSARAWNRSAKHKKDPVYKAESINYVLFEDHGIRGKDEKYKQVIDDPTAYFLHNVLAKKRSSPLALTILYMVIAEQIGLEVECLALPSQFFLKVNDVTTDFYIDPFDSGRFIKPEEFHRRFRIAMERNRMISTNLFEKTTGHQLVARLIQQLKHIYILKGDALTALRAVELLAGLFPQSPEITRDRGILYCEMEYFSRAIEDLRYYLKRRPEAEDVGEIKKLTSMLKGYREIMN